MILASILCMAEALYYARALTATLLVMSGLMPDPTGGSLHYHADYVTPYWVNGDAVHIGNHKFYAGVR